MTDNDLLRAHVTRVGFDLTLARSHIAALVKIEELRLVKWDGARLRYPPRYHPLDRAFAHFVGGVRGLQERGLLVHKMPRYGEQLIDFHRDPDGTPHIYHNPRTWRITKAGRLVIGLLKEAGIYQEYAAAIRIDEEKTA